MKSIKLLFVILITSFLGFSQTQNIYRKMDWQLKDKKINISEAKKEGFAISFRNSDTFACPYKVDFRKMRVNCREDNGNNYTFELFDRYSCFLFFKTLLLLVHTQSFSKSTMNLIK